MEGTVRLTALTEDEFQAYMADGIARFAEGKLKAGSWSPGEALEKSRGVHEKLLPEGMATEGHHFYSIQETQHGQKVGILWLAVRCETARSLGFVYDLFIDTRFRRRGYATQAMRALEGKARELGVEAIALHVFTHNPAAIGLYEKLGYEAKSMNMVKQLSSCGGG